MFHPFCIWVYSQLPFAIDNLELPEDDSVYQYMCTRPCLKDANHHSFRLGFYSRSTSDGGELIHRLNSPAGESVCFF